MTVPALPDYALDGRVRVDVLLDQGTLAEAFANDVREGLTVPERQLSPSRSSVPPRRARRRGWHPAVGATAVGCCAAV
jgi:hypothetical protein